MNLEGQDTSFKDFKSNLEGQSMFTLLKTKLGGLSSTEIILLFIGFIVVAFSVLSLITNTYAGEKAKSYLSETTTNISRDGISYDGDSLVMYINMLNKLIKGQKLSIDDIDSIDMSSDKDPYHEQINIKINYKSNSPLSPEDRESQILNISRAYNNVSTIGSLGYDPNTNTISLIRGAGGSSNMHPNIPLIICDEWEYNDNGICKNRWSGDGSSNNNPYTFRNTTGTILYPKSCNDLLVNDDETFKNTLAGSPYDQSTNAFNNGVYNINPTSTNSTDAFNVYCDMTTNGGGWTLVMKSNENNNELGYDEDIWTEKDNLLNENNFSITDISNSKYRAFSYMPITEKVMVIMNGVSPSFTLVESLKDKTMHELVNKELTNWATSSDTTENILSSTQSPWNILRTNSGITSGIERYNGTRFGFNIRGTVVESKIRIGIITDNYNPLANPDSPEGIGLNARNNVGSRSGERTLNSGRLQWMYTPQYYNGLIYIK